MSNAEMYRQAPATGIDHAREYWEELQSARRLLRQALDKPGDAEWLEDVRAFLAAKGKKR